MPTPEEPFIYQGRVYVPLRFVAEALGQEVKWDPVTWTVVIGEKPGATFMALAAIEAAGWHHECDRKFRQGG